MLILGITDGNRYLSDDMEDSNNILNHDSSVALVKDGKVIAAIEEERLNRVKHSNKHPEYAVQAVFENTPYSLADVDKVCIFSLSHTSILKKNSLYERTEFIPHTKRIVDFLYKSTGIQYDEQKIHFIPHQLCHAMVSYFQSGFNDSLIISLDGVGDFISGAILHSDGETINYLDYIPEYKSLGNFYNEVILHLGYSMFDEYKVMGMAPYGRPEVFQKEFDSLYTLLPEGRFEFHREKFAALADLVGPRKNELTQEHKDFAMGLQVALENIILHMAKHHQSLTGARNLCLSGGVAFNCSSNGNLLKSGLFEKIFVHPASHDAGGALGAALCAYHLGLDYSDIRRSQFAINQSTPKYKLENVYWGKEIGNNDQILQVLNQWKDLISFEKVNDIAVYTAQLIAEDNVIGWVQGRSEFGPRALGNRSILADPRPSKNKSRINEMVKLREGYRPFAPSIMKEYAADFYEFPETQDEFPFMTFILDTRQDKIDLLGAVTHIDGTARVQTVTKESNNLYWNLINEFRKITGTPILLNTSFNNNVEPIVDSIGDAIVCYLTTQLNYLVIGDYIIKKKDFMATLGGLTLFKLPYTVTECRNGVFQLYFNYSYKKKIKLSRFLFHFLIDLDESKTIASQLPADFSPAEKQDLIKEIYGLWCNRAIRLAP